MIIPRHLLRTISRDFFLSKNKIAVESFAVTIL